MPLTPQELRQRAADSHAKAAAEAKTLLDAANGASQTVAALHIAFMAVCAYVLVIVFGTTDLDLLMGGNNVKLPVIDVAVPIVGFYAAAPYLVVLMHLNLLLQLQLLSRKLFAFDATTPAEEGVGGLRDRLHIFPYTYYLVGRPSAIVGGLLGLVVSVTLIVLPLATLLAMQLKFLAYQAESITWAQRVAVFLDVGFLVALWPVILHPRDDWKAWWRETLAVHLPKKRAWLAVIVLVSSVVLVLFAATPDIFTVGLILGAAAPLLLIVPDGGFSDERVRRAVILLAVLLGLLAVLWKLISDSNDSLPSTQIGILIALFLGALPLSFFWHPKAPLGSLALLSALGLGPFLTLGLMVDGEFWETTTAKAQEPIFAWQMLDRGQRHVDNPEEFKMGNILVAQFEDRNCASIGQTVLSCIVLAEQRRLDLNEQSLFIKPPNPELLAALRAGNGLKNVDKLERISLAGRSLRHARMEFALVVGGDLRRVQLQGARLGGAQLQGADLTETQLEDANLKGARLQGANLKGAQLKGADLTEAQLQGVNLSKAKCQSKDGKPFAWILTGVQLQDTDLSGGRFWGARLEGAKLQGANLTSAHLKEANLTGAKLQGANLTSAHLEEANLTGALLQGANLSNAYLEEASLGGTRLQGANLRGAYLKYASLDSAQLQGVDLGGAQLQGANLTGALLRGVNLKGSTLYQNGDPAPSDLVDIRGTVVRPLPPGRMTSALKFDNATTFTSCLTDQESQPKRQPACGATDLDQQHECNQLECKELYDAIKPDQQHEFMKRLHEVLVTLACEDTYTARGILGQIPRPNSESDSTRVGLATVLLARMKASEPCPGLAGLSAEYKAELERLAKEEEAEHQQAAKAASAVRQ